MDLWSKTKHLFGSDDGSLPDIEFDVKKNGAHGHVYSFLTDCSNKLESEGAYYWSIPKQLEVPISYGENPADLVPAKLSEPFHVVFGGPVSPSGHRVPSLGLFIFTEAISLDYRMGSEWNEKAVIGLFEILRALSDIVGSNFRHMGNLNDEGSELEGIYKLWLDQAPPNNALERTDER